MLFKHPEILYALVLLAIPIIIHLFQLRRFQKQPFTNVAFLKAITLKTRKSAIIKKWLVLITRLLLLSALILAFSQPYTTNKDSYNSKEETVIYLDNSFSMNAKGTNSTLLKKAINDLVDNLSSSEFTLITNDKQFLNTNINRIKNEILEINTSSESLSYDAAWLQAKKYFSDDASTLKHLIFISDFQQNFEFPNIDNLKGINPYFIQLKPQTVNNISIDSAYISKSTPNNIELTVKLVNSGSTVNDFPISLFNNEELLAKTAVDIDDQTSSVFTLPNNTAINGKLTINDSQLHFDNSLFFNINKPTKINVLSINSNEDDFLRKIFNPSEFNYIGTKLNDLNYNLLESQNLIILNELESIPNPLITAIKSFKDGGGSLLLIPNKTINLSSYNHLFENLNLPKFSNLNKQEKSVVNINFSHPLLKDVFSKEVKNFQYPKVQSHYTIEGSVSSVLSYEDSKPFLFNKDQVFVFTGALNTSNSNFKNSPLIVPSVYNIGKQSLKVPKLYYSIGDNNSIDIPVKLGQDDILKLYKKDLQIIPQQQTFSHKVSITTNESPNEAGIYNIMMKTDTIENISFNYNRKESNMKYLDLSNLQTKSIYNSVSDALNTIKSNTKVNELWKWFVIFALLMLILEMLILKFFK